PERGRLVGILDWTDAALGDPALDFAVLVPWRGWEFLGEARSAYRVPLDPGFERRVRVLARVFSLVWLHESRESGTDVEKHLRWVANAFSEPG
nr:phosphotransferase [Gemmatimonadota bacterium]NIR81267.1 phosphotransferase [Gemmatimonadota bacterium]NIT86902.1 phosphotransferase [Gemmatimonadota bacterium]NIU33929.1 phosphotransferase [Gemmatimonadota bacterium]NIU38108.1 phosphotransferase [Gemmatimonadota bacterium]